MLNYTISRRRGKFVLTEKDQKGNTTETLYDRIMPLFIGLEAHLKLKPLEKVNIMVREKFEHYHRRSDYTIDKSIREAASTIKKEHNSFIYSPA